MALTGCLRFYESANPIMLGHNHLQHLQRVEQQLRHGKQHLIQNNIRIIIKIIKTKYESIEFVVLIESGLTKSICPGM